MAPKPRVPIRPSVQLPGLVTVADPKIYYMVQALFQAEGVTLVDLDDGSHITGQVNIPQMGMIAFKANSTTKYGFGLIPPIKRDRNDYVAPQNVDATLGCEQINPDEGQSMFCVIQVVDDDFLDNWIELANHIANTLAKREWRGAYPQVAFGITSLCLPEASDPQPAKNAVLRKIQGYGFNNEAYAVAHNPLPIDHFDGEEEEP